MDLLGRQSQNLCPKNAEPVFTGCCGRFSLSIWAVSFALRVKTMLIFVTYLEKMSCPFFHLAMEQKIASFLIFPISFLFFSVAGDLLFSQIPLHRNIRKGEGQVYLHLAPTRNSILANPACQFTSLSSFESFRQIHVLSMPSQRHSMQMMCTSSNIC